MPGWWPAVANDHFEARDARTGGSACRSLQVPTISFGCRPAKDRSRGAEWLLDNYYIVLDNIREVRHDLPSGYYRELQKLGRGPSLVAASVCPGIRLIAHTDCVLDEPDDPVRSALSNGHAAHHW